MKNNKDFITPINQKVNLIQKLDVIDTRLIFDKSGKNYEYNYKSCHTRVYQVDMISFFDPFYKNNFPTDDIVILLTSTSVQCLFNLYDQFLCVKLQSNIVFYSQPLAVVHIPLKYVKHD